MKIELVTCVFIVVMLLSSANGNWNIKMVNQVAWKNLNALCFFYLGMDALYNRFFSGKTECWEVTDIGVDGIYLCKKDYYDSSCESMRLFEDKKTWVEFIRHEVAAGRIFLPEDVYYYLDVMWK